MSDYLKQLDDEREILAPLVETPEPVAPAVAPTQPVHFAPQVPKGAEVPGFDPKGYGPGADAAALAQAEVDRDKIDRSAKLLDAATSFNKAFGGNLGDLAAPARAQRDDSFKDVMRRRTMDDQDLARRKMEHEAATTASLARGDSPESVRVKEQFSASTIGARLRKQMGEEGWARLPGNAIPNAKEILASETTLLKSAEPKPQNAADDPNSAASKSMQIGYAAFLRAQDPKKYETFKDTIPTLSANAIKELGSVSLRKEGLDQPAFRIMTDPEGFVRGYDRKRPPSGLPPALNGGPPGEAPPVDTSVAVKEPGGMEAAPPPAPRAPAMAPGETPKDFIKRKDAIRSAGSPPTDWKWDPKVLTGEVAPPAKAEVEKVNELTKDVATALDYKEHIDDFLKQHPNGFPGGIEATKAAEWNAGLQTMVRSAMKMGVYRAFDQPILDKAAADPTNLMTILKSAVGIRDLRTQMQTLGQEISQRAWSENQSIHRMPDEQGRFAGFAPRVGHATSDGSSKTVVKKFHNEATNKTRLIYGDGSQEVVDGLR